MMKKMIIVLSIMGMVVSAFADTGEGKSGHKYSPFKERIKAHQEMQKSENRSFRKTVKDMDSTRRQEAVISQRDIQYQENVAFYDAVHQERLSLVRKKLNKNEKLDATQKDEIIYFAQSQYIEKKEFRAKQHAESIAFIKQMAQNSDLSREQKKEMARAYAEKQREKNKQFRHQQKQENRIKRQEIKSTI